MQRAPLEKAYSKESSVSGRTRAIFNVWGAADACTQCAWCQCTRATWVKRAVREPWRKADLQMIRLSSNPRQERRQHLLSLMKTALLREHQKEQHKERRRKRICRRANCRTGLHQRSGSLSLVRSSVLAVESDGARNVRSELVSTHGRQ